MHKSKLTFNLKRDHVTSNYPQWSSHFDLLSYSCTSSCIISNRCNLVGVVFDNCFVTINWYYTIFIALQCLFRWGLIIHGGIDGYSRLMVFLRLSSNNRAETVVESLSLLQQSLVFHPEYDATMVERMWKSPHSWMYTEAPVEEAV